MLRLVQLKKRNVRRVALVDEPHLRRCSKQALQSTNSSTKQSPQEPRSATRFGSVLNQIQRTVRWCKSVPRAWAEPCAIRSAQRKKIASLPPRRWA